jgi:hypothetical protein
MQAELKKVQKAQAIYEKEQGLGKQEAEVREFSTYFNRLAKIPGVSVNVDHDKLPKHLQVVVDKFHTQKKKGAPKKTKL